MIASTLRFLAATFLATFILIVVLGSGHVLAGGGPENVFLVVNPQSVDSMTVANHYIRMRDIPSRNVFYLDWNPDEGLTNVDTFREKILMPILKAIQDRGLIGQVDYVVYSTDYPWGIGLKSDVHRFMTGKGPDGKPANGSAKPPQMKEWPKVLSKRGSLTGMTYLYQLVLTKMPIYMSLDANRYMRIMKDHKQTVPTIAFSNRLRFDAEGKPTKELTGGKYLLSVGLGVTGKHGRRGNTVEEILQYLERSVKADATFPKGVIYYDVHDGTRSKTRQPDFAAAIEALARLGVQAEIIHKYPPKGAMNIMGLTLGLVAIDLKPWLRGIRPGAICDNLTSFAGAMDAKAGQTPITDFLAAGMAGASGAVEEPYAIPAKFPSPMIHVHYARGCSLAEAFYQSIHGPYQMLILGEPLCKPWAHVPQVSIQMRPAKEGAPDVPQKVEPNQTISGKVTFIPSSTHSDRKKAHHFELYLDGHLVGICLYGGEVPIDTARLGDGYHEVRVVAVAPQPVYTRGYKLVTIQTANHGHSIEVEHSPSGEVSLGRPIQIQAKCPGAQQIDVYHNDRSLGTIEGASGKVEIDTRKLGKGPVTLQVIGLLGKGLKNRVFGKPISLEIK